MSAGDLIRRLQSLGVSLRVRRGNLTVSPKGRVSPELREEVQAHKEELLSLLYSPQGVKKCVGFVSASGTAAREACASAWEAAMSGMAKAWDAYTARCQAAGREPTWLDDDALTQ